jgi:hypothetical protein
MTFKEQIIQGIPEELPSPYKYDPEINHAPRRKDILNEQEKELALRNALALFCFSPPPHLLAEFKEELEKYGRIYMYRFKPEYKMYARAVEEYPGKSSQAKGNHANDPEQPGPCRSPTPGGINHLWRERRGFSKLGAVPAGNEIPGRNGG